MLDTFNFFPTDYSVLQGTDGQKAFKWNILNFFETEYFKSESFLLSGAEWFLEIYTNGNKKPDSQGWVGLYLNRKDYPSAMNVNFEIGVKNIDGSILKSDNFVVLFDNNAKNWGAHRFIKNSELRKSKNIVASDGNVTFFCSIHVQGVFSIDRACASDDYTNLLLNKIKALEEKSKELEKKLSASVKKYEVSQRNFQESKSKIKALEEKSKKLEKKLSTSVKKYEVLQENFQESKSKIKVLEEKSKDLEEKLSASREEYKVTHENFQKSESKVKAQVEKSKDLEEKLSVARKKNEVYDDKFQELEKGVLMLSQHFEELFLTGYQADVIIKVKDSQFKAHKSVLAARSTVFRAMFDVDMTEKNCGSVAIEEFEPNIVEDFLKFLYCGKFDIISNSNSAGLYLMADKYNVNELKEPCCKCLPHEISQEYFFEAILIAKLHNEKNLLKTAIDYFLNNTCKIFISPQWLRLLQEYPVIANELLQEMAKSK